MLNRLFPEILSWIMILTQEMTASEKMTTTFIDDDDDGDDHPTPQPQPFEILISHVNSKIRYVALHTCRLWSSIHLKGGDKHTMFKYIKAHISRSGGHLLDIRMELTSISIGVNSQLDQALELIAAHSRRWRRLSIVAESEGFTGPGGAIVACLVGAMEGLIPELEYLSISVDYNEIGALGDFGLAHGEDGTLLHHPASQIAIESLPKLSVLRLRGLALYTFHLNLHPSIRVLHLDQTKALPISYTHFYSITQACPLLEHLSIYGDIDITSHTTAGAHVSALGVGIGISHGPGKRCIRAINLPELRSLRICGTRGLVYRILLSNIEAPSLSSLVLKDAQEHDLDILWEELLATPIAPSKTGSDGSSARGPTESTLRFKQVQSLTICNSDLSKVAYRRLFEIFPAITEFASYSSMEFDLVPTLFVDTMNIPWPNLRVMTFMFNMDLDDDHGEMEEMLSRRRKDGCPVDKLRICVAHPDEEDGIGNMEGESVDAVVVEKLDEYDIWPTNRLYPDIDDILF